MSRPAYIVIHGAGGTLDDVFRLLLALEKTPCLWYDGDFYVAKPRGVVIRKLLSENDGRSAFITAIQKQIVACLLDACQNPERPRDLKHYIVIREMMLLDDFPEFAIPFGPVSRQHAAARLRQEGQLELLASLTEQHSCQCGNTHPLATMLRALANTDGSRLAEKDAIAACRVFFRDADMVDAITGIRDMMETGGDLDTVASAVFYAHYLRNSADTVDGASSYGREYQFVFVNYHEGLGHLADICEKGSDLYMADMPIAAIPDLPGDLRSMQYKDIVLKRYEDHHPYQQKHLDMLAALKKDGLIGTFAMSGPLEGAEQAEEEMKCGADMVYEALIEEKPWETNAMKHLRDLAHREDFASDRKPLGILITELIKGGVNKVDLAQTLLTCSAAEEIEQVLKNRGWQERIECERQQYAEIADRFMEHVKMIEIERTEAMRMAGGPAYGEGSDMPLPLARQAATDKVINALFVLAPKTERHEPKLNIGRACEYFRKAVPNADYLFFCYGSSLIVSRRLNQADASLNLATVMKQIGTNEDGGHAGAAVCSPQNNPAYPTHLLGNVSGAGFSGFCRYLCSRLSDSLGTNVRIKRNLSVKSVHSTRFTQGGIKLLYVVLAALLVGGLYLLIDRDYRSAFIRKANSSFFPWIAPEAPGRDSTGSADEEEDGQ